jgi:hypothetical protein
MKTKTKNKKATQSKHHNFQKQSSCCSETTDEAPLINEMKNVDRSNLTTYLSPRYDNLRDEPDGCVQWRMSRTHVFLRFMHPELESARKEIWERPDEDGQRGRRP